MTRISGASIGRRAKPQRVCGECGSAAAGVDLQCRQGKCGGRTVLFASQAESRRFGELRLMQRAGEIHSLKCHPKFDLNIRDPETFRITKVGVYTADFSYGVKGAKVIEDVKPHKTMRGVRKPLMSEAAALRIRLFEALYGLKVRFVE